MKIVKFLNAEIADVNPSDYPDLTDAYVSSCDVVLSDGTKREATEDDLDYINENFEEEVHELALENI